MKIKHPEGDEFEARQMCLDFFGHAARIVLPIIVKLNKDLRAWEKPKRQRVKGGAVQLLLALVRPLKAWKLAAQSQLAL